MQTSIHAQWVETTPWPKRIIVFLALTIIDLAFNAAAGAAAAAAGANKNGLAHNSIGLSDIVAMGALAGTMKSGLVGISNAAQRFGGLSTGMYLLLIIVLNPFGICALITTTIYQRVFEDSVPRELLIASIVTALPLTFDIVSPDSFAASRLGTISLIGWDALAGYTFARMAQNQGYEVCALNAAAAAGAVYGTLSAVKGIIVNLLNCAYSEMYSTEEGTRGEVTSLLGSWEVHDPLPLNTMPSHYDRYGAS